MLRKLKGQSTLEYAMIIAVVVGALLAIQIYMKRGVQGKLRESSDKIGEQFDAEKTDINRTTNRFGTTVETVSAGKTTKSSGTLPGSTAETTTEFGSDTVGAW